MNIQYTNKELREITCLNILKMLMHQGKVTDVPKALEELGQKIHDEQIFIPISGESSNSAMLVTFLTTSNVTGQSFGDEVIQKAKAQSEWTVEGHIWILDKNQSTKNQLREFFTIDTKNKVDEISGGRITRKEKAMKYNILIFEWYIFHGDWFAKIVTPTNFTIEENETLTKSQERNIKMSCHDRLATMLNLPTDKKVIVHMDRYSETTGFARCARLVIKK